MLRFTHTRARNYFEQIVVFFLLASVILTKLWTYFLFSKKKEKNSFFQKQENEKGRVQLWIPHNNPNCKGTFNVFLEGPNISTSCVLTVREAIVDHRHVSTKDAEKKGITSPFRRIQVLMTALPHPANNNTFLIEYDKEESKTAHLSDSSGTTTKSVDVKFEYLIQDGRCQRACGRWGHCAMREWQAIILMTPLNHMSDEDFENHLMILSDSNHRLNLNMPVTILPTREARNISVVISLSCVALISKESKIPNAVLLPKRANTCPNAKGAVALAGAPVFGKNSSDVLSWKRIGHYAARHLYGHTWFDTVVIAIHPKYTFAEIQSSCTKLSPNVSECKQNLIRKNVESASQVRQVVEKELAALKVPREEWHRIYITSFCGLGSDFNDKEIGWPCQQSHQGGQKVWGHFSFTAFVPYHKWASNFDLDEFLVDELAYDREKLTDVAQRYQSAYKRFNLLEQETKKSSFYATWLDFQIDEKDTINLTRKVMKGHRTKFSSLKNQDSTFNLQACYGQGGKVITSCRQSVSFMIHYALNIKRGEDLSNPKCEPSRNPSRRTVLNETEIYTYHARRYSRQGSCLYNPDLRTYAVN